MVNVVGGSGAFSGPTGAQYQQAGVNALADAGAQQRAFREAKRQAIESEIWKYAQDYGAQMGVPAASAFDDPNFRAFAVQKYGNVLGGLFGIGGQARAEGQVDALGRMDTGQLAAQQDVERQFRSGNLSLGQEVQRTIDPDQVNQYLASLKEAGPPQPAPAPVAPGQTPAPAAPAAPVAPGPGPGQLGQSITPAGTAAVTPAVGAPIAVAPMTPEQIAAAAYDPEAAGFQGALGKTNEELLKAQEDAVIAKWGYDPATGQMKVENYGSPKAPISDIQKAANDPSNPVAMRAAQRILAANKLAPAGGSPSGVGAGTPAAAPAASTTTPAPASTNPPDPNSLDLATLQTFWDKMYKEKKVSNPRASEESMRKLVADNPGSYSRLMGGAAPAETTPASTTGATPSSSLDVARKLGLSAEEVAAINKAGSADPGSMSSAEYALYRRGMEKIKNAAVKETRTTKLEIKPGMENDPYVQDAVRLYGIMDPNGPYAKDPRTVQLTENLASLAIQGKKAEMERNLAAAGLDRAQAEVVKGNAMASAVMAEAEMMKAQNENLKNLMTALDSSVKPLFENYSKELSTAKNEKEVESVKKKYADILSNDPAFKGVYDVYVDLLKKRGGDQYQVNLEEVLIDKYFFGIKVGQESAGKVASVNTGNGGQDPTGGLTVSSEAEAAMQNNRW